MTYVIVNALLYIITLIIYWHKRRKIDAGFFLLSVYALIAIACVINYAADPNEWKLQLWPFVYLFIICILFFRPYFFDSDLIYEKLYVKNKTILKIFALFYVFFAFIAIYYSVFQAIDNLKYGNWAILRNELYQDNIELYTNQFERIAKIFADYLRPVAIVLFFYYLTLKKIRPIWLIILVLSIILPAFLTAINTASRGLLINLAVPLSIGYIIFRKNISKHIKRIFIIFLLFLVSLFLIYSLAVTISRFGETNQKSSVLYYFGHSMLTFNYGIVDSIRNYMNGEFFFHWFYEKLGILKYNGVNHFQLGTHFGTAFFTFVGAWYLDFGPVGTFLIALFFPVIIGSCFRYKKRIDIADIYMYLFYLNYLIVGVFVIGSGNALSWLVAFIIYGILKITK